MRVHSRYKQVRITLTEEPDWAHPGSVRIGMRVLVKSITEEWYDRHLVLEVEEGNLPPLRDMDAVYSALVELLSTPPIPVAAR